MHPAAIVCRIPCEGAVCHRRRGGIVVHPAAVGGAVSIGDCKAVQSGVVRAVDTAAGALPVNAGEIALPVACIARYFRAREAAVNRHAFLHCYDRGGRGRICARRDPDFIATGGSDHCVLNGILCIGPGRAIARSRTARHDVEDIRPRQCRQQQRQNEY